MFDVLITVMALLGPMWSDIPPSIGALWLFLWHVPVRFLILTVNLSTL